MLLDWKPNAVGTGGNVLMIIVSFGEELLGSVDVIRMKVLELTHAIAKLRV